MQRKFKRALALTLTLVLCVVSVADPVMGASRPVLGKGSITAVDPATDGKAPADGTGNQTKETGKDRGGNGPGDGTGEGDTTGEGTLSGKVQVSASTTPIPGAVVKIVGATSSYEVSTDAAGEYAVVLPVGTYNVTVGAAGYATQSLATEVKSGSQTILNVALVPANVAYGQISGKVTDAVTGQSLAGANIRLSGETLQATQTDTYGEYVLTDVAAGSYDVNASVYGYQTSTTTVNVVADQATICDLALQPASFDFGVRNLTASQTAVNELAPEVVQLAADIVGTPVAYNWTQIKGPKVPVVIQGATASISVSSLNVAVETELKFSLSITDEQGNTASQVVSVWVLPTDMAAALGDYVQIGGSANALAKYNVDGQEWCLFNIGSKLKSTPIATSKGVAYELILPGFIKDMTIVNYNNRNYALVAVGKAGLSVVDVTDPANMQLIKTTKVSYYKEGITFAETGGSILPNNVISGFGSITCVAADNTNVFLGNANFGIHKTTLANVFADTGTDVLTIEQEAFTLQYAAENPWGGPASIEIYKDKLVVGLNYLGMVIYDANTLERVGYYNLYTDEARTEDFAGAMKISEAVGSDPVTGEKFLDQVTGMPDYRQVNYEIMQVMKGDVVASTPWADFDRRGKWFYNVRDVDIAVQGQRTIAYVAYSLGGVVAVDITGVETASTTNFLQGQYLGYFPAVPANGAETTGQQSKSLLPYQGAGMFKESGIISIEVKGDKVYATDHFAGLVILAGASTPETSWRGANPPYNNDTDGIADNNIPEMEHITTYDMSPWDPADNESLPAAHFQAPCLLATTELNGHGNKFLLMDNMDIENPDTVDVLECSGGGGFVFVDVKDLTATNMEDRFAILAYYPSTDEVGAAVDGSPSQTITIGHTSGLDASDKYLYVSDGPHGISAWKITDAEGYASDEVGLVANTVQDEYPQTINGETIYPPSHTVNNVISPDKTTTWAACVGNGLRRVNIEDVEAGVGQVGAPMLIKLHENDSFEHNADWGTVREFNYQDHVYDVEFIGNYAFVADGSNGLTVYDVSKDPTDPTSGFFINNIGKAKTQPMLGNCSGVELWTDPISGNDYAITACGPYGVGVVDITDVYNLKLIKVFEPIKYEDGDLGSADGQAIDVSVIGEKAYFSYDSFGIVCYNISDLVAPLQGGVDPTELFKKSNSGEAIYDYRPIAAGRFKLQLVPGYETMSGGANRLVYTMYNDRLYVYAAFSEAGVLKIDFTDSANPILLQQKDTIGECGDVAIANGRVYAADGTGGFLIFN